MYATPTSAAPAVLAEKPTNTSTSCDRLVSDAKPRTPAPESTHAASGDHDRSLSSEASTPASEFGSGKTYTLEDFDIGSQLGRGKFGGYGVLVLEIRLVVLCKRLIVASLWLVFMVLLRARTVQATCSRCVKRKPRPFWP